MNREPGLCRQICVFSRVHRQEQGHQQRRRAALARHVADGDDDPAVGQRQDVVEVSADRIGGPRRAADLDVARGVRAVRQHRQLDLARHLELALQRQPIRDLEQDEEIDHQQADQESERPVRPRREEDRDLEERRPEGNVDHREAAEQLDQAEQRNRQRSQVERTPGSRQLQREGDEDLEEPYGGLLPPRQAPDLLFVEAAAEETVGVARVVREEPLQLLRRQITGIGVEPFPRAVAA